MKPILKSLKLNKHDYFETHLSLINCVLPTHLKLTPMEIKVLAIFMSFEGDIGKDRFGSTARNLVKKELGMSSGGLSNYMRYFREKKVLTPQGDILPLFFPDRKEQSYNFKLTRNEDAG